MLNLLTIGSMVASLLGAPVAVEPAATPPTPTTINVVTVNGSGCPSGTTSVQYSADHGSVIVYFDSLRALTGDGAAATDARKNCQLSLDIPVPDGWTYTVNRTDLFGYAQLDSGANGLAQTSYYFQGMSDTARVSHAFSGPLAENWQTTDLGIADLGYHPCDGQRNLNVNVEVRASGGSDGTSYVSTDTFVLNSESLNWRRC